MTSEIFRSYEYLCTLYLKACSAMFAVSSVCSLAVSVVEKALGLSSSTPRLAALQIYPSASVSPQSWSNGQNVAREAFKSGKGARPTAADRSQSDRMDPRRPGGHSFLPSKSVTDMLQVDKWCRMENPPLWWVHTPPRHRLHKTCNPKASLSQSPMCTHARN